MPVVVTLVLLLFWLAIAYRSFQRGDLLMAGIFLLVGVVLTVYRLRTSVARAEQPPDPNPKQP